MALLVEEVLSAWREGERLLETLPSLDPDHETVARSVAELRELYAVMTDRSDVSRAKLEVSRLALERSRATIEKVRTRLSP